MYGICIIYVYNMCIVYTDMLIDKKIKIKVKKSEIF